MTRSPGVQEGIQLAPPAVSPRWVPASVIDEGVLAINSVAAPWTIELEVEVAGRLDEGRLRAAVRSALEKHPMARARTEPGLALGRRFRWEIPEVPDTDPLDAVSCATEACVGEARAELLSSGIPLWRSPPLRVRLVRRATADVLMLSLHHAAADGISALRILHSIARAYAGEAEVLPGIDPSAVRDPAALGRDSGIRAAIRRAGAQVGELRRAPARSARLAPARGEDRPGYGFLHLALPAAQTAWLIGSARSSVATVNDLALAALHLAIGEWNQAHGVPANRVRLMMPVNLRPQPWWDEVVGNYAFMVPVDTRPSDRADACRAIAAVSRRTRHVKHEHIAAASVAVLRRLQNLPSAAKRALATLANADRLAPTALLSNLGVVEGRIGFGSEAGEVTGLWFSPPTKMPYGLAVGTLTYLSRLHISFRYLHPLLSPAEARSFAARYVETLEAVATAAAGCTHEPSDANPSSRRRHVMFANVLVKLPLRRYPAGFTRPLLRPQRPARPCPRREAGPSASVVQGVPTA